jgi:hypothetical protein
MCVSPLGITRTVRLVRPPIKISALQFSLSPILASAQAQKQLIVEPSTLGVAGSCSKMVKPTKSLDAIVSTNRFAILGAATFENQNLRTLAGAGTSADGTTTYVLPASQGTISKVPVVKNIVQKQSNIPGLSFSSAVQGKFPRDRSNSVKRKNSAEDLSNPKSVRLTTDCPHLKVNDENKVMLTRTLDSIADYKGNDPVLADGIRNLSICMDSINEILGVVMAERLVPGTSPDVQIYEEVSGGSQSQASKFSFSSTAANSRKPLKQKPLGDSDTWATAVSRGSKKAQQVKSNHLSIPTDNVDPGTPANHNKETPFVKAVKEAERSLLIFNLDMGQSPIMNPSTISKKVTLSLHDHAGIKIGLEKGNHTQDSRDLVDDIMSQVVRMEFFGSKTSPCKFPGNSKQNASFYTVPVKLVFKDRRTAQTAAELLRKHLDLNSITPYHKSLKAAMTQAINRAKTANPGHHAKVNLDLNGRTLKFLICTEGNPPGSWTPWGNNIPIPSAALDPGTKDITKVVLPTSPNSPEIRGPGKSKSLEKSTDKGKDTNSSWADDISDSEQDKNDDMVDKDDPSIPGGAEMRRLKLLASYPPSTGDSNVFSGRSSLTLKTPPRISNEKDGSFGS